MLNPIPHAWGAVLPYPPSVNMYWRTVSRLGGRQLAHPRTLVSKEGREYKAQVAAKFPLTPNPAQGPVVVKLWAYRPRKLGDLDNILKSLFDALKGIAWVDDSQIVEIHAHRLDDKENPRVEIEVLPA